MRHVADQHDVPLITFNGIPHPQRRIVGLKTARGGQLCERVTGAPHGFGSLAGPQLAAVPDDFRLRAASVSAPGEIVGVHTAFERQWPLGIDERVGGLSMMNQEEHRHVSAA